MNQYHSAVFDFMGSQREQGNSCTARLNARWKKRVQPLPGPTAGFRAAMAASPLHSADAKLQAPSWSSYRKI